MVRQWDNDLQTPYFDILGDKQATVWDPPGTPINPTKPGLGCNRCNYIVDGEKETRRHRIYYDDPSSLSIKYAWVVSAGLRGVGMWTADAAILAMGPQLADEMWAAVPYKRQAQLKSDDSQLPAAVAAAAAASSTLSTDAISIDFNGRGVITAVWDTRSQRNVVLNGTGGHHPGNVTLLSVVFGGCSGCGAGAAAANETIPTAPLSVTTHHAVGTTKPRAITAAFPGGASVTVTATLDDDDGFIELSVTEVPVCPCV